MLFQVERDTFVGDLLRQRNDEIPYEERNERQVRHQLEHDDGCSREPEVIHAVRRDHEGYDPSTKQDAQSA